MNRGQTVAESKPLEKKAPQPGSSTPAKVRLKIISQAFRYCEYGAGRGQTRTLRTKTAPIQFIVNTWCDEALKDKEVEIAVEIRDRQSDQAVFETFWVTTLAHARQQSAFIFRELPEEFANLQVGKYYLYYASALVVQTEDFAERKTRAVVQ